MDTRETDRITHGFYRARLDDSDVLYEVIDRDMFPTAIGEIIQMLKDPRYYVFISADDDAILAYQPTFGELPWLSVHSWTKPSGRGVRLKKFYWGTGIWIIENTEFTTIAALIPDEYRMHGLFLAQCDAIRQAYVDGVTLYTFSYEELNNIKEKLKCLKD